MIVSPPELWGIPVATIALIVAGASFVIAVGALGWQIAKHLLDGGRIKVKLNLAIWQANGALFTNDSGRLDLGPLKRFSESSNSAAQIEMAKVVVENPSRFPLTIVDVGLWIGRSQHRRYHVGPILVDVNETGDNMQSGPRRIEPYDQTAYFFDLWPALTNSIPRRTRITVRAHARVAGKRFPRRSSWRLKWKLDPQAHTFDPTATKLNPESVLYQGLYRGRLTGPDGKAHSAMSIAALARQAALRLGTVDDPFDFEVVHDAVAAAASFTGIDKNLAGLSSFRAHTALESVKDRLGAWPPANANLKARFEKERLSQADGSDKSRT